MTHRSKLIAVATVGGLANVAFVLALYARGGSSALDSTVGTVGVAGPAFLFGALALGITAYTGLVTPAASFVGLAGSVAYADLRSLPPERWQLGEHTVFDGPLYITYYANQWELLLSLLLVVGVAEFGIRRGYGLGERRLRNLPSLPLSRRLLLLLTAAVGALIGVSTFAAVDARATVGVSDSLVIVVGTGAVTAVPLAALLSCGLVLPLLLYLVVVPRFLLYEAFGLTDSYVAVLALGPYALVLLIAWVLEGWVRSRCRGRDGGTFAKWTNGP